MYLAAAAYNGGPGRIARGLTRYADDLEGTTGDDLFFALAEKDYLRNETREYVPQLIAAALIAKDPDRYGMKIGRLAPYAYDSVRVGPSTPLAAVAHAASEKLSAVHELNPQVLRGITPPKDSLFVRVPVGQRRRVRRRVRLPAEERAHRVPHRGVEEGRELRVARQARGSYGAPTRAVQSEGENAQERKSGAWSDDSRSDGAGCRGGDVRSGSVDRALSIVARRRRCTS